MKWFLDLTTRTKLFLSFGLIIVILAAIVITAFNTITTISQSQEDFYNEDFLVTRDLMHFVSDLNRVRACLTMILIMDDLSAKEHWHEQMKEADKDQDERIASLREKLKNNPRSSAKLEEMLSILNTFRKTRDEKGVPLMYANDYKEARKVFAGPQTERYEKMRSMTLEMVNFEMEHAKNRTAMTKQMAENSTHLFVFMGFVAILLCIAAVLFLTRILATPLREMSAAAERIASGDLNVVIHPEERQDEVGNLTKAFASMTQYLRHIASVSIDVAGGDLTAKVAPLSDKDILGKTFADMIENLRRTSQEIRDGVNVLASSTSEILASTTQVVSAMTETATSVTETTATVEEAKQTAQLSADKSRSVSEGAHKAALIAEQGYASVNETVEGIGRIKEQMESVVGSIVRLSEQTQAIGEIITAVNDLAQQSNLLAVNAAIEASKAGEHGKGFSVVAQEIKSLADQSKQATGQVRTILGDIQKAATASVLAAEQVSKAVDLGVKQAIESGESIRLLAQSIAESAQSATQIAASSQQMFAGMDQISMAMENIKQAAGQNITGTKQAEQAAYGLNELGQKLKDIVGQYKV